MKISKKSIKADEFIDEILDSVTDDIGEGGEPKPSPSPCYEECIDYIHQAIDCLAACATETGDPKAKEAIANLSVVLLDLQG